MINLITPENLITVLISLLIFIPILTSLVIYFRMKKIRRQKVLRIIGFKRYSLNRDDVVSELKKENLLKEILEVKVDCIESRNEANEPIWVVRAVCGKEVQGLEIFPLSRKENAVATALSDRNSINQTINAVKKMLEAKKFKSTTSLDLDQEELLMKLKK